jgi:hypothetical protein
LQGLSREEDAVDLQHFLWHFTAGLDNVLTHQKRCMQG